jgi:hypothetical protein
MFYPDLRPVVCHITQLGLINTFYSLQWGSYRTQNYHSIDLDMIEIPDHFMKFVHVSF